MLWWLWLWLSLSETTAETQSCEAKLSLAVHQGLGSAQRVGLIPELHRFRTSLAKGLGSKCSCANGSLRISAYDDGLLGYEVHLRRLCFEDLLHKLGSHWPGGSLGSAEEAEGGCRIFHSELTHLQMELEVCPAGEGFSTSFRPVPHLLWPALAVCFSLSVLALAGSIFVWYRVQSMTEYCLSVCTPLRRSARSYLSNNGVAEVGSLGTPMADWFVTTPELPAEEFAAAFLAMEEAEEELCTPHYPFDWDFWGGWERIRDPSDPFKGTVDLRRWHGSVWMGWRGLFPLLAALAKRGGEGRPASAQQPLRTFCARSTELLRRRLAMMGMGGSENSEDAPTQILDPKAAALAEQSFRSQPPPPAKPAPRAKQQSELTKSSQAYSSNEAPASALLVSKTQSFNSASKDSSDDRDSNGVAWDTADSSLPSPLLRSTILDASTHR